MRQVRRRSLAAPLALAILLLLPVGASAAAPPSILLTEGWQFRAAGQTAWRTVTVPHLFDRSPRKAAFGGTVGEYRARFNVGRLPAGFAWGVRFDQVRRTARVWLDGRLIGTHRDPYVPFTLPAGRLSPGAHTLTVRVSNLKGKEPREGWWNWGGISKPVRLVPQGTLTAEAPGLLSRLVGGRWNVLADVEMVNRSAGRVVPRIAVGVRAPDGTVSEKTVAGRPLAAGERARVRFDVPVSGKPALWTPDAPQLYDATLQIRDGATVVQEETRRIGLRSVSVADGLLHLNGKAVELRGASIQEDAAGSGAALSDADVEWIVRELKAMGANVTRAHYLLDERLLRRFDEEGILVWSQAPIYHRDRLLETPAQRAQALATVRGTVLGARSHPSVLTHSVANELSVVPDEVPGTRAFLLAARSLTRDLDPTLPASVDLLSYPGYDRQETYAKFPLLGINSYFGWYEGKPGRSVARIEDLGPFLRRQHKLYPASALVVTEFGAESTFEGPANVKETYAFQTDYVRRSLATIEATPEIGGAIYWTLREFAVKPDWDGGAKRTGVPRDAIHNKALITYDGRRKPAWQVMADDARNTPLWRDGGEVAAALNIRMPEGGRGAGGTTLALLVLGAFVTLCAVDVWAFVGLRRALRAAERPEPHPDPAPHPARAVA
jgi:beta-glucuronidase